MNSSFIESTLEVSKLFKLNEVNEIQSLNIESILVSEWVSKFDKSTDVKFWQLLKKDSNVSILWALNFELNDAKLIQSSRKLFIFVTELVSISLKSIEVILWHDLNI